MTRELQRFGWCWDHSTNWTPGVHGRQTIGTNRSYLKRPEVFLSDFKRLLDFLGKRKFAGLCVWGLIRQSHGGVEAAREIVRYGRERGVAVTPGVGLFAYGGAFYEGRHEYNLETFALAHPECVATVEEDSPEPLRFTRAADGTPAPDLEDAYLRRKRPWVQLCPSRPEVISWAKDAASWVIEALDLETVMLEAGDVFTCECDACRQRRRRAGDRHVSLPDLFAGYIPLVEHLRRRHPGVRIQCETYAAPGTAPAGAPMRFGALIPEDCLRLFDAVPAEVQLELFYDKTMADESLNLPGRIAQRTLLRTEMGTQWRGPRSHGCAEGIAAMCRVARRLGIPSVSMFVEEPDTTPAHWVNYKAFEAFPKEDMPFETFVERDVAPHLGDGERARAFIRWASDPKCSDTREGIKFAQRGASTSADEEEFLRWAWLGRFIAEYGATDYSLMAPFFEAPLSAT